MSADSFHHQIELSMKQKGDVCDFSDFQEAVQAANSGKVEVCSMKVLDFFDWKDCSSQTKLRKVTPRAYISEITMVCATRGKNTIEYFRNYDENIPCELNFLTAQAMKQGVKKPECRKSPRGIPQVKKDGIVNKICPLMPKNRRQFWQSLPADSGVSDLYVSFD